MKEEDTGGRGCIGLRRDRRKAEEESRKLEVKAIRKRLEKINKRDK